MLTQTLKELRRVFVSSISQILDPETFNHEVAKIIRKKHIGIKNDPTAGNLIPGENTSNKAEVLLDRIRRSIKT
jgi:hypothetical protein